MESLSFRTYEDLYTSAKTAKKTTINGVPAVKNIVKRDGELICHQYHWTQDGFDIFMVLYRSIAEKYDEKDFFDIHKIIIPK